MVQYAKFKKIFFYLGAGAAGPKYYYGGDGGHGWHDGHDGGHYFKCYMNILYFYYLFQFLPSSYLSQINF